MEKKEPMFKWKPGGKSSELFIFNFNFFKKPTIPGNTNTAYTKFSYANWEDDTPDYMGYARALQDSDWEDILTSAKVLIRSSHATDDCEDGPVSSEEHILALPPLEASDDELEQSAPTKAASPVCAQED